MDDSPTPGAGMADSGSDSNIDSENDDILNETGPTAVDSDEKSWHSGLLRGRTLFAASAIALGIIVAVVIVSVSAEDDPAEPSAPGAGQEISAEDTVATDSGSVTVASTDGPFEIVLDEGADGLLHLKVTDPATPVTDDAAPTHCVHVTVSGPTSVEAYGCTDVPGAAPAELRLSAPGEPIIGCAAVATREPAAPLSQLEASSEFNITEGVDLPAGEYDVTIIAVTGIGDGCTPAEDGTEREASANGSLSVG